MQAFFVWRLFPENMLLLYAIGLWEIPYVSISLFAGLPAHLPVTGYGLLIMMVFLCHAYWTDLICIIGLLILFLVTGTIKTLFVGSSVTVSYYYFLNNILSDNVNFYANHFSKSQRGWIFIQYCFNITWLSILYITLLLWIHHLG